MQPLASEALPWDPPQSEEQPTASARTRSEEVDTVFGTQPAAFPDDSDVPKPDRRGKRLAGLQAAKEGRNAAQGSQ